MEWRRNLAYPFGLRKDIEHNAYEGVATGQCPGNNCCSSRFVNLKKPLFVEQRAQCFHSERRRWVTQLIDGNTLPIRTIRQSEIEVYDREHEADQALSIRCEALTNDLRQLEMAVI